MNKYKQLSKQLEKAEKALQQHKILPSDRVLLFKEIKQIEHQIQEYINKEAPKHYIVYDGDEIIASFDYVGELNDFCVTMTGIPYIGNNHFWWYGSRYFPENDTLQTYLVYDATKNRSRKFPFYA